MPPTAEQIRPVLPNRNFGTDPLPDFHEIISELRNAGHRVVPVRYIEGIAWLIIRHGDVDNAYRNERELPAAQAYRRHAEPVQGKTLLAMEGEEHRINRLLVARAFHPPAVRSLAESLLAPLANSLIDAFAGRRQLDLVAEYTYRYPFQVISRMLGIPVADEAQLLGWIDGLFMYPWNPEAALQAKHEIDAYLRPIIRQRRSQPADDLISALAQAEAEGRRLSDEQILAFIKLLYPAGADTTYLSIGSLMFEVLRDPQLKEALRADPARRAQAVEESLRMHGTVCLQPRYTEQAVVIGGVAIPADSWLLFGNSPANHDPAVFADPERFDLDRQQRKLMTFGAGPHFCLGAHLARAEMTVSLSLLLDRLPGLRIVDVDTARPSGAVLRGPRLMQIAYDEVRPACEPRGLPGMTRKPRN